MAGTSIVTVLFTDLVGSSDLFSRLGDDRAETVLQAHLAVLGEIVGERRGQVVKTTGDGVMAVFPSVLDALAAAVAIQTVSSPAERVRIGLQAGEPIREGDDYFGTPVIVARRLCDSAAGGQILAGEVVAALAGSRGTFRFRPLRALALKGVAGPVGAVEVVTGAGLAGEVAPDYLVLGPIQVAGETGLDTPLSGSRQRLLLAVLVSRAGAVVDPDELVEALWDDEDRPADPRASLQNQVWRLRAALAAPTRPGPDPPEGEPSPPIDTTPAGYRFNAPARVDAVRFEALVAEGRRSRDDPAAALACWERALALWRGRAFGDLSDHPALRTVAAHLDGLRMEAAQGHVEALLALGEVSRALEAAETLAAGDPFGERPVELRMRAMAGAGRFVDALRVYETFRRRLGEELGLEPSPALRALEGEILRHEGSQSPTQVTPAPGPAARVVRSPTLAVPPDAFVARAAEMDRLVELLGRQRLVSLTGPGGVGKTRLALHLVDRVAAGYPDGVWCCDLAAVESDERVVGAVASTLRVEGYAGATMTERIVEVLAAKRALLMLDNCEHLLDGSADLVRAVLAGTAAVAVLVTSREPLGLAGEQRFPLEPLAVPGVAEVDAPAVELFVARARAANPSFSLDDEALGEICGLCRQVDGLPLAIELIAARAASRTLGEIAAEVAERLGDIPGGRGRPARQRSTNALVGWSYDLLDDGDRRAFERLSVFAGGWTAEGAAAVALPSDASAVDVSGAGGSGAGAAIDLLTRFVDQSLVSSRARGTTSRYLFLETVRAYGEARLRQRGASDDARDRHARYFVDLVTAADEGLRGPDEPAWVARLDDEVANLRVAHDWMVARNDADGALRLAAGLYCYVYSSGSSEMAGWAQRVATHFAGSSHPALPAAGATAAIGAWMQGDLAGARHLAQAGIAAGAAHGPAAGRAALSALGDVECFEGRFDLAFAMYRESADQSRGVGDHVCEVYSLAAAAMVLAYAGRDDQARATADEAMAVATAHRTPTPLAWAYYAAGEARRDHDPEAAGPLLERAVAEAAAVPNRFCLAAAELSAVSCLVRGADAAKALARYPRLISYWELAGAWNQQWQTIRTLIEALTGAGHAEAAAVLYGALEASPTATTIAGPDVARLEAALSRLSSTLGPEAAAALRARGAALGDPGAVSYALDALRSLGAGR